MEIALQNGFYELHDEEMLDVTAGGWGEFALATAGWEQ